MKLNVTFNEENATFVKFIETNSRFSANLGAQDGSAEHIVEQHGDEQVISPVIINNDGMTPNAEFRESNSTFDVDLGDYTSGESVRDYNVLYNKPSINDIVLRGNKSLEDLSLRPIYYDTTAGWDSQRYLVSQPGAIYIYSDHDTTTDEQGRRINVPGIRIGDGRAYVIDLPFVGDNILVQLLAHIDDNDIHVTAADRAFWDDKLAVSISAQDNENVVFYNVIRS